MGTIALERGRTIFTARAGATNPPTKTFKVNNSGTGSLAWTAASDQSWCTVTPSGVAAGDLTITVATGSLAASATPYTATVTVTDATATNSPQTHKVTFLVRSATSAPADAGGALMHSYGPMYWWRMDDSSGDFANREGTGSATAAASGLTYSQAALAAGTSIDFDGTNGYGTMTDRDSLDLAGEYTLIIFCRPDVFGLTQRLIAKGASYGFRFHTTGAIEAYQFIAGAQKTRAIAAAQFAAGNTYMIAVTFDRTIAAAGLSQAMKVFRNGVLGDSSGVDATYNGDVDAVATNLFIGSNNSSVPIVEPFNGRLDELAILNKALTATQLLDLYNAYTTGTTVPLIENLTDDFSDGTANTDGKWPLVEAGVTESGGRLHIVPTLGYPTFRSAYSYELRGSHALVEVPVAAALGNGTQEAVFQVRDAAGNRLMITREGANLRVGWQIGATFNLTNITYDAVQHRWWRIRELAGTIYWETSLSGAAGSWVVRRSVAAPFALSAVMAIQISAGYYGTETTLVTSEFDNVNTEGTQVLRPDADTTTTGWTATPLFSKVNDQSDATVITATAS